MDLSDLSNGAKLYNVLIFDPSSCRIFIIFKEAYIEVSVLSIICAA